MDPKPSKISDWIVNPTRRRKAQWDRQDGRCKCCVKAVALSTAVLIILLIVYFFVISLVANAVITQLLELRNGSLTLSWWQCQPLPLVTRVYIWNLTNPQEVTSGSASPHFKEVGPYVFDQFKEKFPTEYKKDSIVYFARSKYVFRADLTAPASLDDTVVTLNSALYGIAVSVEKLGPSMLNTLPSLFSDTDSVFTPLRVGSYLFEGLNINCTEAAGTLKQIICNSLPKFAPPNIRQKEGSLEYSYSFIGHKNYTLQGPYEEDRGMSSILRLGQLVGYRNQSTLGVWQKGSTCDKIQGTDTSIFAPFIRKTDRIDLFIPDICQYISIFYEKGDFMEGVSVFKFSLSDNFLASIDKNPGNKCFCLKKSKFCHSNGVRDVAACMRAPVIISQPHFYLAEEQFHSYARGMSPEKELHTSMVYIEPQTGLPMKGTKRLQFNLHLRRIKGFNMVQNVSEGLFPLLWYEESALLTDPVLARLKRPLMIQRWVYSVCLLLLVVTSTVIVSLIVALLYLRRALCFRLLPFNTVTVSY